MVALLKHDIKAAVRVAIKRPFGRPSTLPACDGLLPPSAKAPGRGRKGAPRHPAAHARIPEGARAWAHASDPPPVPIAALVPDQQELAQRHRALLAVEPIVTFLTEDRGIPANAVAAALIVAGANLLHIRPCSEADRERPATPPWRLDRGTSYAAAAA